MSYSNAYMMDVVYAFAAAKTKKKVVAKKKTTTPVKKTTTITATKTNPSPPLVKSGTTTSASSSSRPSGGSMITGQSTSTNTVAKSTQLKGGQKKALNNMIKAGVIAPPIRTDAGGVQAARKRITAAIKNAPVRTAALDLAAKDAATAARNAAKSLTQKQQSSAVPSFQQLAKIQGATNAIVPVKKQSTAIVTSIKNSPSPTITDASTAAQNVARTIRTRKGFLLPSQQTRYNTQGLFQQPSTNTQQIVDKALTDAVTGAKIAATDVKNASLKPGPPVKYKGKLWNSINGKLVPIGNLTNTQPIDNISKTVMNRPNTALEQSRLNQQAKNSALNILNNPSIVKSLSQADMQRLKSIAVMNNLTKTVGVVATNTQPTQVNQNQFNIVNQQGQSNVQGGTKGSTAKPADTIGMIAMGLGMLGNSISNFLFPKSGTKPGVGTIAPPIPGIQLVFAETQKKRIDPTTLGSIAQPQGSARYESGPFAPVRGVGRPFGRVGITPTQKYYSAFDQLGYWNPGSRFSDQYAPELKTGKAVGTNIKNVPGNLLSYGNTSNPVSIPLHTGTGISNQRKMQNQNLINAIQQDAANTNKTGVTIVTANPQLPNQNVGRGTGVPQSGQNKSPIDMIGNAIAMGLGNLLQGKTLTGDNIDLRTIFETG